MSLVTHPGRLILLPFVHWFKKRYAGRYKFARTVFLADLFLVGLALGLLITAGLLTFFPKHSLADDLYLEVTVAPAEVVSGAPSTLVIRYTNGTGEELRDVSLSLTYPAHFELQEILAEQAVMDGEKIILGTLAPGDVGSLKITGVMFGDVGGEQLFRTLMIFAYGEENNVIQKTSEHRFSPARSVLELTLSVPEPLVSHQTVSGTITYRNTGVTDIPEISIEPVWPEGFTLTESQPRLVDKRFSLPSIAAGEQGTVSFSGYLETTQEEVVFTLFPSFAFGQTFYRQETLAQTCRVIPPQLALSLDVDRNTWRPGSNAAVTLMYENTGNVPVYHAVLGVRSDSPFFAQKTIDADEVAEIQPGQKGQILLSVPLRSSVSASELSVYENISVAMTPFATYTLGGEDGQDISYAGKPWSSIMTSPLILESFARYALPSGDQLGRGPLPPRVGEETKYWIFWHVSGTTNPLGQVRIEGILPSYVSFTGRQTVSQNGGVNYDTITRTVSWTSDTISPTLNPSNPTVGIAFEVSLVPTEEQKGTTPVLLSDIQITATDKTTGAFVGATSLTITTDLPDDLMAGGKGMVE